MVETIIRGRDLMVILSDETVMKRRKAGFRDEERRNRRWKSVQALERTESTRK